VNCAMRAAISGDVTDELQILPATPLQGAVGVLEPFQPGGIVEKCPHRGFVERSK